MSVGQGDARVSDELPPEAISVSAQFGGGPGSTLVKPHFFELKKALRSAGREIPCEVIREIAFILRVDGDIVQFNFEGCERIELNRRKKYISIDVGVPVARWKDRSDLEIAEYLAVSMRDGLEQMLSRLRAEKLSCDDATVRAMFEEGMARYLANWVSSAAEVESSRSL